MHPQGPPSKHWRDDCLLADLSWPDADCRARDALLAVPVGATEQHGPHLPLSTDTEIALGLAEGLSRERPRVVVAPSVAYGSSGEHCEFAGTLSIGQEATELLLIELGRSASLTFRRVLLISTHGGNAQPVMRALRRLREEGRDVRGFFPGWSCDAHAGRTETSLMLALAPTRVQLGRAESGVTAPLSDLLPRLAADGVRKISPNGILGDPAGASAQEGWRLLRRGINELVGLVDAWELGA
jgi:mycofactocin system creatininase family protein